MYHVGFISGFVLWEQMHSVGGGYIHNVHLQLYVQIICMHACFSLQLMAHDEEPTKFLGKGGPILSGGGGGGANVLAALQPSTPHPPRNTV